MKNNFAELITSAMAASGIGRKELVGKLGYTNLTKGLRRVDSWRAGEPEVAPQLVVAADILGLTQESVFAAIKLDAECARKAVMDARAADPNYYLYIRLFPCVVMTKELDISACRNLSIEAILEMAKSIHPGFKRELTTPQLESYHIDEENEVGGPFCFREPMGMSFRKKRIEFFENKDGTCKLRAK